MIASDADLLTGEDPSTTDVEEARRWVDAYNEMLRTIGRLPSNLELEAASRRCGRRAAYWRLRLEKLTQAQARPLR